MQLLQPRVGTGFFGSIRQNYLQIRDEFSAEGRVVF
jgi:hypothetical protein